MSWNLGGIIIQTRWDEAETNLLKKLGLPTEMKSRQIDIADTLELSSFWSSIRVEDDYTLILNRLLPYNLSYKSPFSSPLDKKLKQLSQTAPILVFFMDGITATFGLCIFEDGNVLRARKVVSGEMVADYGKPYPEEFDLDDEEERIFVLTARWLGIPLDELFFAPSFDMNVYGK